MTLVGPLSLVATCVFGIPVAIGQTVGMEEIVTVIGVRFVEVIVLPIFFVVIDMVDEKAFSRNAIVPPLLLAVLQEVILVGVGRVADDVGIATVA